MSGIEILDRYLADIEKGTALDALEELKDHFDHLPICMDECEPCEHVQMIVTGGDYTRPINDLLVIIQDALERKP